MSECAKFIGFLSSSLGSQAVRINIGNAYIYTLRGHQLFNLYQVLQPALEQGVLQEGVGLVLHAHAALPWLWPHAVSAPLFCTLYRTSSCVRVFLWRSLKDRFLIGWVPTLCAAAVVVLARPAGSNKQAATAGTAAQNIQSSNSAAATVFVASQCIKRFSDRD